MSKKIKEDVTPIMQLYLSGIPLNFSKITKINSPNFIFTIDTFGKDTVEYRVIYSSSFEEFIEKNHEYIKGFLTK